MRIKRDPAEPGTWQTLNKSYLLLLLLLEGQTVVKWGTGIPGHTSTLSHPCGRISRPMRRLQYGTWPEFVPHLTLPAEAAEPRGDSPGLLP